MQEPKKRGRPNIYLTRQEFREFLRGDFWHLKMLVWIVLGMGITILGAVVASIVVSAL